MSKETSSWLNQNTLIGFTTKRGNAWHYRESDQGDEPNHYEGAIPVADVKRRLFGWVAEEHDVTVAGTSRIIPNRKAITRSDTGDVLGMFRSSYLPHQYGEWLVDSVATMLSGEVAIGSAGLLRNGALAWVSVEVPENVVTPAGVEFRPNLLATTSHDGTVASTYKRVVTNVVCDNTHAAAMGEAGPAVKVRHSKYSNLRMAEARDALGIIWSTADAFTAEVERLCAEAVSPKRWDGFLTEFVPIPADAGKHARTLGDKKRDELSLLWTQDARVAPWAGTAWGVVQAVNTHAHHIIGTRGGAARAERNMLRAVSGETADLDSETLRVLSRV